MKFHTQVLLAAVAIAALLSGPRLARALVFPDTSATNGAANSTKFAPTTYVAPTPAAPNVPTKITLTGAASVGATMATAGLCVRISCTVTCSYRVTLGADTATVDDNQLPANTPERFCLDKVHDTVTFFSTPAGTAYLAVLEP